MSKTASAHLRRAAPVFAALGDDLRLHMVARLCKGEPLSIARLAEDVPITRQAVTKHLHVLEQAGVIKSARCGREQIFELRPDSIAQAKQHLNAISMQWDGALARLKTLVEKEDP